MELVRQFPVIWNSQLNCFHDHAKKKNARYQINTVLSGSISSEIKYFFTGELNTSFLSVDFFLIKRFP